MSELQPPAQAPIFDKTGCAVLGAVLALFFAYTFLYELPAKQRYERELAAWYQRHPEEAPAGYWTQRPERAPPGWFHEHPEQAPPGWFAPGEDPREAGGAAVGSGSVAAVGSGGVAAVGSGTPAVASSGEGAPSVAANPHDDAIPFATGEHEILLSTRGASVREATLKNILETTYKPVQTRAEDLREPGPYKALHPYLDEVPHFGLCPLDEELTGALTADWRHEALPGGVHRFRLVLPNGLVLRKTYTPPQALPRAAGDDADAPPRPFHFELTVEIQNPTGSERSFGYRLLGPAGMVDQEVARASYGREYALAVRRADGEIEQELDPVRKLESVDPAKPDVALDGEVAYFGTVTKYFAGVVIPLAGPGPTLRPGSHVVRAAAMGLVPFARGRAPTESELAGDDGVGDQGVSFGLVPRFQIPPGGAVTHHYAVFLGPRQEDELFEAPPYEGLGLENMVYHGWGIFGVFARVLLWILTGLHAVTGNWGVAILLLTVLVRSSMLPLSIWSQKNMLRMQKLAPELNKLKEKFSGPDGSMTPEQQRAFQQAQMELWRKHGVNPVGCIGPMFLQMPVFIGLYNALNYAVAMRHSKFAFWITDLSIPDVAARLPFTIPLLGTNALSILPLLMVGTYALQQKIQPPPADEKAAEQQRIMKFVMPFFGFLFYTMPSGLLLYFITSSLWSIGETLTVKKKILAQEGGRGHKRGAGLPGLRAKKAE
ncbi:MAG: membrane protein insertase YidC [Planctomycetota bacterium]|nr:MAG: membrane protein insertase YidC [Planctomycetota bacterium]